MLRRQNTGFELTLSLFAVIFLILGVTVWLLIPEAKAYLQLQDDVQSAVERSDRLQMEYDRLYETKEQLAMADARLSERFENGIDAVQLQAWITTVLKDAPLTVTASAHGFEVSARLKTPLAFYALIDRLDTAPWVLKVGPSLSMQAEGNGVQVIFSLHLLQQPVSPAPQ
ncbi:cell division protein ZapB [Sulfurimonas sp. HSL-1656]|uniref:cell division protein ZapB n=1 Tax=Thiomicrolovo subterrani TaxID=3131934 RepID=UPI0031F7613C